MDDGLVFIGLWLACGILAAFVAHYKENGFVGFILGILFGPLGVIASLGIDGRRQCVNCNSRVNGMPDECPYCHWRNPVG